MFADVYRCRHNTALCALYESLSMEWFEVWAHHRWWAEWSHHHHQLDGHHHHQQMALVPPWWWVRDDIFPSNAMQPFSPTILALPSSSSASVISLSLEILHQQIAGQPQGMHRCTPRCYKKRQSFHFWKISAHWAGLLGHPILSRQKVPRSQRLRQEKGSQRQSLNVGRSFCGK